MLSAFWKLFGAPFIRPNFAQIENTAFEIEQQILSELVVAAEIGMVATRFQEPEVVVDFKKSPPKGTPHSGSKRKRLSSDHDSIAEDGRAAKRCKEMGAVRASPLVHGSGNLKIPVVAPLVDNTNTPRDGIEVRIVNDHGPDLSHSVSKVEAGSTKPNRQLLQPFVRKSSNSPIKENVVAKSLLRLNSSKGLKIPDKQMSPSDVPKAEHKRFGSEDLREEHPSNLDPDVVNGTMTGNPVKVEVDIESENEAPETVTASKGLDQARSAAIEAAKVADTQRAREKQKRRDRDVRLKFQAKSARLSKRDLSSFTPETDSPISPSTLTGSAHDRNTDSEVRPLASRKSRLPVLLPEEILSAEPTVRPPTPPPEKPNVEGRLAKKRKLLDSDSKPPKDIRRGSLTVRILDSGQGNMPPKASKETKMLREAWLTGQRGPKSSVERRKLGGGFRRKR